MTLARASVCLSTLVLLAVPVTSGSSRQIIYVDDDVRGGGDGSSWANAFQFLQDAIAVAGPGDEIRIAQGCYTPDKGTGFVPGDPTAQFVLIDGITLRGGFAGLNHQDPDAHDWNSFPTVLSGDLSGDDGPHWSTPTYAENAFSILRAENLSITVTLQNLIVEGGNGGVRVPDSSGLAGGGLVAIASRLVITDCVFEECWSGFWGGGQSHYSML